MNIPKMLTKTFPFLLQLSVCLGSPQYLLAPSFYLISNEVPVTQVVPQVLPVVQNYGLFDFDLGRILSGPKNDNERQSFLDARAQFPLPQTTVGSNGAKTNLSICYFLGNDVVDSHLLHNKKWWFNSQNYEGLSNYLNDLTYSTNIFLGLQNYKLKWKGPYARSDSDKRYPENMSPDSLKTANSGCDVVVFLVFNNYTASQTTNGHKYSGFVSGGACDNAFGKGYAVIVDQGYFKDVWMGPQILAHHLLLMLTVDLWDGSKPLENRFCPNENSLLNQSIRAGQQIVDQCVIDKLNRSNVSIRPCLLDD